MTYIGSRLHAILRRWWALGWSFRNVLRMFRALAETPKALQPDQGLKKSLPKRIFECPADVSRTPGGLSAAYLRLAARCWQDTWSKSENGATSPYDAALRIIHMDVQRAHVLERAILEHLDVQV